MTPPKASASSTRFIRPACFALLASFLAFASRGILSSYSYWLDELYSVSGSIDTWENLFKKWILTDVHPPLYHILLKLWMRFFGSTESTTRLLSLGFSFITLFTFSFDAISGRRWRRVIALCLVGASPFFSYYAQETRAYALVLALSSAVTLLALELRSRAKESASSTTKTLSLAYYAGAFLLSLTHYFGWFFVFVISAINGIENRMWHARRRGIIFIAAISIWPACHVAFGDLGKKTGGDFWIKISPPIVGTINNFRSGCLPFLSVDRSLPVLLFWALIAALVIASARNWKALTARISSDRDGVGVIADETKFCSLSVALVVALLSIVDLHTPMSTPKNYLVLLPAVMIALANSLAILANARGEAGLPGAASSLLMVVITFLLARQSWSGLSAKLEAYQNWKALSKYVEETGTCSDGCLAIGSYGLHTFYFSGSGSIEDLSSSRTLDQQADYVKPLLDTKILGFHGACETVAGLMDAGKDRECIQPSQTWENSTFLVLPKSSLSGEEKKFGMRRCSIPVRD